MNADTPTREAPRAPPVFTLTGNLLAERTCTFDRWSPGRTHRARAESFQVGGKGINVARMLTRLGIPNTALCFTGGASGAECEQWLRARGIAFHPFATRTPTRMGLVIRDASGAHPETTFLGPDVIPDAEALAACAAFLEVQPDGAVLALSGSFPGWSEPAVAPVRDALRRWSERGTLVIDTYGPPLAWAATQPAALIKINADELRPLAGQPDGALPSLPRGWVITDGPGLVRVRAEGRETRFRPPAVREVSPTGSGDVLLAGILHAQLTQGASLVEAVRAAIPLAAANAAHAAVAEFTLPVDPAFADVETLT